MLKRSSGRVAAIALLVVTLGSAGGVPAGAVPHVAPAWQRFVLGPSSEQVPPVAVESRGSVSDSRTLLRGKGKPATLTTVAGGTPASVVLDFGQDVAGTPNVDVTAVAGTPTLTLVTDEARQFLRQPAATTVTTAVAAGAATVTVASTANLEVGNTITIGTRTGTITAFDPTARTVTFAPALAADVPVSTAVSTSPGAPASDEARGLAGVGGMDTLRPAAPGRLAGNFHGGFRFVLLTLATPGSVSIAAAHVDFQAFRATPADYRGWFRSSDNQLNRMWYSGAYTLQLDLKPAGLNGLSDARIYDGAKRDRSIWTCDLLVQTPTAISTLGDVGAAYVKSALNVLLATQRADGALPGSPDFRKGTNPAGSPLFYSDNYSGCGARAVIAYYRYTGDQAYLIGELPALRAELAYNQTFLDANNLVVSNDRDYWQAVQTGEVTEYSIDYYLVLQDMAWVERRVGSGAAADIDDARAEAIKTAINARLWNPALGAYGQSSDHPGVLVEDANALALQNGIVPAERQAGVLAALRTLWTPFGAIIGPGLQDPTGHVIEPFGNGMETGGRFAVGDTVGALSLMRRTWGPMVDPGNPLYTGGLWEFKNSAGGVDRATASLAHGWAASPTVQLTQDVLGVTPVDPGYATWNIAPHPGGLAWAEGAVPTKFGEIAVRWSSRAGRFALHVTAPTGTSGTITVPANAVVILDGHVVRHHGAAPLTVSGGRHDILVIQK